MNIYTNLPAPVRIAIPMVGVLILGALVWMMMLKPPAPVGVVKTDDVGTFQVARKLLEDKGIEVDESRSGTTYELLVAPADQTAAYEVLDGAGLKDRTGMAKKITCPAAPGFTANKAKTEEYNNCEAAKKVQGMLLTAGATAANVTVSQEENGTLIGPEKSINVSAQVFLTDAMKTTWDAAAAAIAIKGAVGTSIDRIYIGDDRLMPLFDGSRGDNATAGATAAAGGTSGCAGMETATEIATKEAAVRSCYESTIGTKLTTLLGGSDRFVLTVAAEIDAVSTMTQKETSTRGPVVASSSQTGSGSSVKDVTTPPNTTSTSESKAAGDIGKLSLSVALDRNNVNANQELAIKRLLQTYVDTSRKDPTPQVTRFAFPKGTGVAPKAAAGGANVAPVAMGGVEQKPDVVTETKTPKPVLAMLAVLVLGMIAAVLIMWRKSAAMKEERARMETAFQNDQRLFENFAQQNPQALATDLEALFGAPAAQR
jgi:hypothetical protein